jgi:hypothetical protein
MGQRATSVHKMFVVSSTRNFRSDFKNPYKYDPVELSEVERTKQDILPVWERIFDHKKYMEIEGPLKVRPIQSTNAYEYSYQQE